MEALTFCLLFCRSLLFHLSVFLSLFHSDGGVCFHPSSSSLSSSFVFFLMMSSGVVDSSSLLLLRSTLILLSLVELLKPSSSSSSSSSLHFLSLSFAFSSFGFHFFCFSLTHSLLQSSTPPLSSFSPLCLPFSVSVHITTSRTSLSNH